MPLDVICGLIKALERYRYVCASLRGWMLSKQLTDDLKESIEW